MAFSVTPLSKTRRRNRLITPGAYRHRISWEVKTETDDNQGGSTITWAHSFYRMMSKEGIRGRERMIAEQLEERVTHRFMGHYKSGLTPYGYRLKDYDGNYYDIKAIIPDDEKQVIEVWAEEVLSKEK